MGLGHVLHLVDLYEVDLVWKEGRVITVCEEVYEHYVFLSVFPGFPGEWTVLFELQM